MRAARSSGATAKRKRPRRHASDSRERTTPKRASVSPPHAPTDANHETEHERSHTDKQDNRAESVEDRADHAVRPLQIGVSLSWTEKLSPSSKFSALTRPTTLPVSSSMIGPPD